MCKLAEREGFILLCNVMFHNDVQNRLNICTTRTWQKDSNPVQCHSVEPALRLLGSGRRRVPVLGRHHRRHPGPLMLPSRRQRTRALVPTQVVVATLTRPRANITDVESRQVVIESSMCKSVRRNINPQNLSDKSTVLSLLSGPKARRRRPG